MVGLFLSITVLSVARSRNVWEGKNNCPFVLYVYTHTCTAKKYPFYGISTNPVLLLIIALSFYCLKYIYTNLVNKLVHACKSSVFHHCTSCDLVLGRRSKADISQLPNPKLSEGIFGN